MSGLEWTGTIFALLCVWLTVKENIWCWPTGIANNLLFAALFAQDRLYADFALQAIYIALGVYGWYEWVRGGPGDGALAVSHTPRRVTVLLPALLAGSTLLIVWGLQFAVTWAGIPQPDFFIWDSATTAGCLVAQWMLARKWLENWLLWIATNVSYIGLYAAKHRPLLCALQLAFIWLSINGYREWQARRPADRACGAVAG